MLLPPSIAPPCPLTALLPVKVELLTIREPEFDIAPPSLPALLESNKALSIVKVPLLLIAPPVPDWIVLLVKIEYFLFSKPLRYLLLPQESHW